MKQSLGKGTVYLMLAELVALVSSYAVQVGVARFLGPEVYGIFGVITALYLINRAFLNTGIPRATSKFVAESKDKVNAIFKTSLKLQLWSGLVFTLFYVFFARFIAGILKDASLTPYIIYLGLMVVPLALLALYSTGYMNGLRLFKEQAKIKILYPLLQAVFTFILVLFGFKIYGVLTGYLLSTLVGLYLSWKYVRITDSDEAVFPVKKLLLFAIPISLSALFFTLMRNVNTLFVKSILVDNATVGLFTAAATLSSLPFSVFGALPVTLLPAVSGSIATGNLHLTRKYISKSVRYLLLILLPLSAIVAATASQILGLLYPNSYQAAASTLAILIFASTFLAIFTTLNAIIVGSGRPILQLMTVSLSVVLLAALNILLIPLFGIVGSALASLISSFVAVVLDGFHVYRHFGKFFDVVSTIRIVLCTLIVYLVARHWHFNSIGLILYTIVLALFYLLLLFLVGELNMGDWHFGRKLMFFWKKE